MSVLTKKQPVRDASGLRLQAVHAARQAAPLAQQAAVQAQQAAQQAGPLARNAGTSILQGADGAMAWAGPKVDAARSWVAPQIEQSAHAISDNLAPMISNALISAAHKIDVPPKKSRGGRRAMLAGALLLTVAAGAAAAYVLRNRPDAGGLPASGEESGLGPVSDDQGPDGSYADGGYEADGAPPDPDVNGHPRIV